MGRKYDENSEPSGCKCHARMSICRHLASVGLILPNGAGDGEIILRSKKAYEDRRPEMGDREKALNGNLPV